MHPSAALEDADLPALLPALAHVTGDFSLLRDDLRIDPTLMMRGPGRPDARGSRTAIRAIAAEVLVRVP